MRRERRHRTGDPKVTRRRQGGQRGVLEPLRLRRARRGRTIRAWRSNRADACRVHARRRGERKLRAEGSHRSSWVTTQSGLLSSNCTSTSRPRAVPDMRPASRATSSSPTSVATGAAARSRSASKSAAASSSSGPRAAAAIGVHLACRPAWGGDCLEQRVEAVDSRHAVLGHLGRGDVARERSLERVAKELGARPKLGHEVEDRSALDARAPKAAPRDCARGREGVGERRPMPKGALALRAVGYSRRRDGIVSNPASVHYCPNDIGALELRSTSPAGAHPSRWPDRRAAPASSRGLSQILN